MPLQNRVDPFSCIHAVPERGLFMGNRGVLHDANKTLVTPRWKTPLWIICTTDVRPGWSPRQLMTPNRYTELFFLDEATAMAAGHRPCAECRHGAWRAYQDAISAVEGRTERPRAPEINRRLHGEMRCYLRKFGSVERPIVAVYELPDGAMFADADRAYLKWRGSAWPWSFSGYGGAERLPQTATRLTPELNCLALKGGYLPELHPSLS